MLVKNTKQYNEYDTVKQSHANLLQNFNENHYLGKKESKRSVFGKKHNSLSLPQNSRRYNNTSIYSGDPSQQSTYYDGGLRQEGYRHKLDSLANNLKVVKNLDFFNDESLEDLKVFKSTGLKQEPSISDILNQAQLRLSPNLDQSQKLSYNRMDDRVIKAGNQMQKFLDMPPVKVTKKKEENLKLEKIIEALQPLKVKKVKKRGGKVERDDSSLERASLHSDFQKT